MWCIVLYQTVYMTFVLRWIHMPASPANIHSNVPNCHVQCTNVDTCDAPSQRSFRFTWVVGFRQNWRQFSLHIFYSRYKSTAGTWRLTVMKESLLRIIQSVSESWLTCLLAAYSAPLHAPLGLLSLVVGPVLATLPCVDDDLVGVRCRGIWLCSRSLHHHTNMLTNECAVGKSEIFDAIFFQWCMHMQWRNSRRMSIHCSKNTRSTTTTWWYVLPLLQHDGMCFQSEY